MHWSILWEDSFPVPSKLQSVPSRPNLRHAYFNIELGCLYRMSVWKRQRLVVSTHLISIIADERWKLVRMCSNHMGRSLPGCTRCLQPFWTCKTFTSSIAKYSQHQLFMHFDQISSAILNHFLCMSTKHFHWPATSHLLWPCRVFRTHCTTRVRIWGK